MKLFEHSRSSHSRKGQAAVEFLTTYGWTFIIIVAVGAGLAYFGFTDAKDNVPSSCRFREAFDCKAYHAVEDGRYAFEVRNVDSKTINITFIVCGFPATDEVVRNEYDEEIDGILLDPGDSHVYYCNASELTSPVEVAGKDIFEVSISYTYLEADPIPKISRGELITEASDDLVLLDNYYDNRRRTAGQGAYPYERPFTP